MKKRMKMIAILAMFASGLVFVACSSDDTSGPVPPKKEIKIPTATVFTDFRKDVLEGEKQYVNTKIDETGGFSFISKKGVKVQVRNLAVRDNWGIEGDEIECAFIELYDKGIMALANRPTMGVYPDRDESGYFDIVKDEYGRISTTGGRGFIITGGEFYFDIKLKGKQVTNYSIDMRVPGKNTRGLQEDMLLWQGNINERDDLTFTEIPMRTEMGFVHQDIETDDYVMLLNGWNDLPSEIGWSNIDKYAEFEGEKTQFFVRVPEGYNYENSAIYFGVKGEEGLAHLDVFLKHSELGFVFTEHYGWVPVGLEGYVFFISVDPDTKQVVYSVKEIKVIKNQLIEIKTNDLKTGTKEEVVSILNGLQ